jgi:hypothetical protein
VGTANWHPHPSLDDRDVALIGLLAPYRNLDPAFLMKPLADLEAASDPPPTLPWLPPGLTHASTAEFLDFVRSSSHVAFRSVVWKSPSGGLPVRFDYRFRGVPEGPATFALRVATDLPPGTLVKIMPSREIASVSVPVIHWGPAPVGGYAGPPLGGTALFELGRLEEVAFDIRVYLPSDTAPGSYETSIDQFRGTDHLGRCTLIVVVPA